MILFDWATYLRYLKSLIRLCRVELVTSIVLPDSLTRCQSALKHWVSSSPAAQVAGDYLINSCSGVSANQCTCVRLTAPSHSVVLCWIYVKDVGPTWIQCCAYLVCLFRSCTWTSHHEVPDVTLPLALSGRYTLSYPRGRHNISFPSCNEICSLIAQCTYEHQD